VARTNRQPGNAKEPPCSRIGCMSAPTVSNACFEPGAQHRAWVGPWPLVLILLLVATACAKVSTPAGSPQPVGRQLPLPALKLAVLDAVGGQLVYCDPDEFPIPSGSTLENATARFPTIKADRATFDAILEYEHLSAGQQFTPGALIAISDDYKQMQAIDLTPTATGYGFSVVAATDVGITRLSGTVGLSGSVTIERREVGQRPNCPICLATGVQIAAPNGPIAVQDLHVGMPVWTTDLRGRRTAGVVLEVGHTEAPIGHEVVSLTLSDGRTVLVSPGHPTADQRLIRDLHAGDQYDGSMVATVVLIPYAGTTWDVLSSGPTGTHFANGVLLGSTLSAGSASHPNAEPSRLRAGLR
jgi:hypothetical protein